MEGKDMMVDEWKEEERKGNDGDGRKGNDVEDGGDGMEMKGKEIKGNDG